MVERDHSAVRTDCFYKADYVSSLKRLHGVSPVSWQWYYFLNINTKVTGISYASLSRKIMKVYYEMDNSAAVGSMRD
jgi:hypothetical protein